MQIIDMQKTPALLTGVFLIDAWQFPTLAWETHTTIGATAFHF